METETVFSRAVFVITAAVNKTQTIPAAMLRVGWAIITGLRAGKISHVSVSRSTGPADSTSWLRCISSVHIWAWFASRQVISPPMTQHPPITAFQQPTITDFQNLPPASSLIGFLADDTCVSPAYSAAPLSLRYSRQQIIER